MPYLEGEHESLNWFRYPHLEDNSVEVFDVKQSWTDTDTLAMTPYLIKFLMKGNLI